MNSKNQRVAKSVILAILILMFIVHCVCIGQKSSKKVQRKQFWKNHDNYNICKPSEKQKDDENACQHTHQQNANTTVQPVQTNSIKKAFFDSVQILNDGLYLFWQFLINFYITVEPKILPYYYSCAKYLLQNTSSQEIKNQLKWYRTNFANSNGGAKILMKSNEQIRETSKVLKQERDSYMYTSTNLPFSIIIGLTEEVSIQAVLLTSNQMYSRTVKQFMVQGKFTSIDSEWIFLGRFIARKSFDTQIFETENKIIRYLKITFISSYQLWRYFTLSQIQVHGKGMFADAVIQKDEEKKKKNNREQERPMCQNNFDQYIQNNDMPDPHDQNLISVLIKKIQRLEEKNSQQNERILEMRQQSRKIGDIQLLKQDYHKLMQYLIFFAGFLALLIVLSSVGVYALRKRQYIPKSNESNKDSRKSGSYNQKWARMSNDLKNNSYKL